MSSVVDEHSLPMNDDPPPIAYAVPDTLPSDSAHHFRSAVLCGSIPLVTGTSVLTAFLATGLEWLPAAGFFILVVGAMLVLAGSIDLWRYVTVIRTSSGRLNPSQRRRVVWVAVLLLANIPAGVFCLIAGLEAMKISFRF